MSLAAPVQPSGTSPTKPAAERSWRAATRRLFFGLSMLRSIRFQSTKAPIDRMLDLAVALGRDLGRGASVPDVPGSVAVAAAVREQDSWVALAPVHQVGVGGPVVGLAGRQRHADRQAVGDDAEADLKRIQVDEIWSFVHAKQKNVRTAKAAPADAGETWTWTAIGADTKLIPP